MDCLDDKEELNYKKINLTKSYPKNRRCAPELFTRQIRFLFLLYERNLRSFAEIRISSIPPSSIRFIRPRRNER